MPYIRKEFRHNSYPLNSGELNYFITRLLIEYVANKVLTYQTINDIVGALECAKQEFIRRVVIPYEDAKIFENGDCYTDEITKIRANPPAEHRA